MIENLFKKLADFQISSSSLHDGKLLPLPQQETESKFLKSIKQSLRAKQQRVEGWYGQQETQENVCMPLSLLGSYSIDSQASFL